MNTFIVEFKYEETLVTLSQMGKIKYKSRLKNLVILKTTTLKEELLTIEGVVAVEKERTGTVFV